MAESISVDILARDFASRKIKDVGEAALGTSGSLKEMSAKLRDIDGRTARARVKLDGDKQAEHELDKISVKLLRLGRTVSNPDISVTGAFRARAEISGLQLALDRLNGSGAGGAAGGLLSAGGLAGVLGKAPGGIGGIVAGLAALPFAAQAAAGGITLALGGALSGIAILGASKTKAVQKSFHELAKTANADLVKIGAPFVPVLTSIANTAGKVLGAMTPVFRDAAKIIAGPFKTFGDTLVKAFGQPAVATSIKAVATAFGDILKALAPQLPGDIKDIAIGITRIANTIKANPGVFAAVISFFFKATGFALSMVAALNSVANYIERHFIPALMDIRHAWDQVRHETAVIFDGMRHDIAHIWDMIFSDTIGNVIRIDRGILTWIGKIPGQVRGVFRSAGTWLFHAGEDVIQGFWNGLTAIWHKVTGFISGIAAWIKAHKGPVHLDAGLLEPAGRALMSGLLRGLVGGFGGIAHFIGGVAGRIAGALGLGGGGGISGVQAAAMKLLGSFGWSAGQFPYLQALWNQESGWRWNALNPSSGAYGIPQALPASKMASAGADWRTNPITQIIWGLGYIRSRYGSPAGAWAHERAFNWYGSGTPPGGLLFSRPTVIGVGERGPERVSITPLGRGGAQTIVLEVHGSGGEFDAFMLRWLQRAVRVRGGNVQAAFGRS